MPNNVTNKIVFEAAQAEEVFKAICPDGKLDFETLIPSPLHVFRGNVGRSEEKDFPLNWYSWNRENWGTKWNCYATSCGIGDDGKAFIQFDTAWSVPYPVIVAFANRFQIPFEHRYFDEGHCFWGIETWGMSTYNDVLTRLSKRRDEPEDERTLCLELKGYWEEDEDEGASKDEDESHIKAEIVLTSDDEFPEALAKLDLFWKATIPEVKDETDKTDNP